MVDLSRFPQAIGGLMRILRLNEQYGKRDCSTIQFKVKRVCKH
ncbi:hypothetical protein L313_1803 [Acinetobacter haemolyticus CIP 64.3 = MTCC 9819]|uniref:Uncharacterized protein n=1 Tax=Acinetobacter haemolyticus ATCC 19194 TaxID=707232 RepID=D4XNA5_ACIHA|nr:hypothetical protein HMPREF0023_2272 [Acinetobacter sp. ATCC 27244]EFF83338.1 hypothetical protein HMP0015_1197 [Acinetobacter haemolyticus ATCC 19194]EPR89087.1 hypothetical protein L313_1803 [Acinetobacter haemolyticus CIP 64.3 = MTCC 9819]